MFPFVYNGYGCISAIWGTTSYITTVPNGNSANGGISITYSGKTMTWYHNPYSEDPSNANEDGQLNSKGKKYYYLAIG